MHKKAWPPAANAWLSDAVGRGVWCILHGQDPPDQVHSGCQTASLLLSLLSTLEESPCILDTFVPATVSEVTKIIKAAPNSKPCCLDHLPTWLLKNCLNIGLLAPVITNIVNQSLSSGEMPSNLNLVVVTLSLTKASLDQDCLGNYRPVPGLSFLSKALLSQHVEASYLV